MFSSGSTAGWLLGVGPASENAGSCLVKGAFTQLKQELSQLPDAGTLAVQKAIIKQGISIIEGFESSLDADDKRKEKLQNIREQLRSVQDSSNSEELSQAIKQAKNDIKTMNVFVETRYIGTTQGVLDISKVSTKQKEPVKARGSDELTTSIQKQRRIFTTSTHRLALVSLVYYILGKDFQDSDFGLLHKEALNSDLFNKEDVFAAQGYWDQERKFETIVFERVWNETLKSQWGPRRYLNYLVAKLVYKVSSAVIFPVLQHSMENLVEKGLMGQIEGLEKDQNIKNLHDILLTRTGVFVKNLVDSYAKTPELGMTGNSLDQDIVGLMEEGIEKRSNRKMDDLKFALVDNLLKNSLKGPYWLFHALIAKILCRIGLLDRLVSLAGNLQEQKQFEYALNQISNIVLEQILNSLNDTKSASVAKTLPKNKESEMRGILRSLFKVIRLSKCHSSQDVTGLLSKKGDLKKLWDENVIIPAAEQGVEALSTALKAVLKKEKMEELTDLCFTLVNQAYLPSELDDKAIEAAADRRATLLKEVLDRVIEKGIDNGLPILNREGQKEIYDTRVKEFKTRLDAFIASLQRAAEQNLQSTVEVFLRQEELHRDEVQQLATLGDGFKGQLLALYGKLAASIDLLTRNLTEENKAMCIDSLTKIETYTQLSLDLVPTEIYEFISDLAKDLVVDEVHGRVDDLSILITKPACIHLIYYLWGLDAVEQGKLFA